MKVPVGISDVAVHIPAPRIDLETIVATRVAQDPPFERRIRRAVELTNQRAIRFPEAWEDSVTLAAQAARTLLSGRNPAEIAALRYLAVGTETTVDHSKPISSYVAGVLQQSGVALPNGLSSFQVQHACAGGTIALVSVAALLQAVSAADETGMVICSDIARYEAPSTAEITQGAGAVAMLVAKNPDLVSFDLSTQGYFSKDVDDFFRPLGSVTAKVRGGYSVQCYNEALEAAFLDHSNRLGETPARVMRETDVFALHVPFASMAHTAMRRLLSNHLGLLDGAADDFLTERGFFEALAATGRIGNIYSGSAYFNLVALLVNRYAEFGDAIVGKRLLLCSYGSGNTMVVIGGRVQPNAPQVIRSWLTGGMWDRVWATERTVDFAEYERWLRRTAPAGGSSPAFDRRPAFDRGPAAGSFYLNAVRDDGYREYRYAE